MKNILLLTSIYPTNDPDYPGTKVCHFFTKEWQKMGYDVRVVHYESCFPQLYYHIGSLFRERIMAKTGSLVVMSTPREPISYEVDDIKVLRVPLKKFVPHGNVLRSSEKNAYEATVHFLEKERFIPDVITAHFFFPQAKFLHELKLIYPNARTCMVLHSNGERIPYYYKKDYVRLMDSVDVWGFRSKSFMEEFEKRFGKKPKEFLCYSGIPANYIKPHVYNYLSGVTKYVFLGSLYKLKNVNITIQALARVYNDEEYTFDIIGDGAEMKNLKKLAKNTGQENKIVFHGRQPREKAQDIMSRAECLIMVSSREAFGLVYLEAMAKGIIPIATRGQGFDGIIINGTNGFLCDSEDVTALEKVLLHIKSLTRKELSKISNCAIETAMELTNEKVAERYIESIIQ